MHVVVLKRGCCMRKSLLRDFRRGLRSIGTRVFECSMVYAALIVFSLFTAVSANGQSAPPAMSITGEESVSPDGTFSYRIPISVPRGTAGMTPTLSLNYSSGDSDGHLGLGWSLNGIPTVTRCSKTLSQDNDHGGISFNNQDRFCYEGKRLVAISGSYGSDGTQYRLEVDNFTEFVSHGTAGSGTNAGPAWFEIHTRRPV